MNNRAEEKRILMMAGWVQDRLANGTGTLTMDEIAKLLATANELAKAIMNENTTVKVEV